MQPYTDTCLPTEEPNQTQYWPEGLTAVRVRGRHTRTGDRYPPSPCFVSFQRICTPLQVNIT